MTEVHVVPNGHGELDWKIETVEPFTELVNPQAKAYRRSELFANQEKAIEVATQWAKELKCELLVHGRDGTIRYRNSYGNDPKSSPG